MAESENDRALRQQDRSGDWGYEGARRFALERAQRMTLAERLDWLERTVLEMRSLCGLATSQETRSGRPRQK